MLKYCSLLLVMLTFTAVSWQTAVVVHFYSNQDTIEKEYCINKEKPEMNCHGKCHLNQQLTAKEEVTDQDKPTIRTTALFTFQLFEELRAFSFFSLKAPTSFRRADIRLNAGVNKALLDPPENC